MIEYLTIEQVIELHDEMLKRYTVAYQGFETKIFSGLQ